MDDKSEKKNQTGTKTPKPSGKPRRGGRKWKILLIPLVVVYVWFFHSVRGNPIQASDSDSYKHAVRRVSHSGITVKSQEDMDDLGVIAHQIVSGAGYAPGPFKMLYLPRVDTTEKLHHIFHSPFTGLETIYTDIWINSCTTYGLKEPTWSVRKAAAMPADKLSILIILIDRLKREKSTFREHIGAYLEVFSGMKLHTLPGRASCYRLLLEQCARDAALAKFVRNQLGRRGGLALDESELDFWNYMVNQPTRVDLERLAELNELPVIQKRKKKIDCAAVFHKLMKEYK